MNAESFAEVLPLLPSTENPKQVFVDGVAYILYEDHRWLLPIVRCSQQKGALPKPCTVIMFDRHHDAVDPPKGAMEDLWRLRSEPSLQGAVSLCIESLRKTDDWLKTGMELGFFGDALIFGVRDVSEVERYRFRVDHVGGQHRIEITSWLPRSSLAYQGHISDVIRRCEFEPMWKILGWEHRGGDKRFRFLPSLPKILLIIDLDCFAIPWSDYVFAWPTKVFEAEFLESSEYWSTDGWTGRSFLQGLAKKPDW
jgi:hypothetical protein